MSDISVELPQTDPQKGMEQARAIAGDVLERHYGDATVNSAEEAATIAHELATLLLARISVVGDVKMHMEVARHARQLVANRYKMNEADLGNIGML